MRVLLRQAKTGLYWESADCWTAEAEKARDFETSTRAAFFAQDNGQEDFEVYLEFGDCEYDVRLPLQSPGSLNKA